MFQFTLRKCFFLTNLCVLVVLAVAVLSIFKRWLAGERFTSLFFPDLMEEEYERQVLEDEARITPGLGDGGQAADLFGGGRRGGGQSQVIYVDTYLSDRISYTRTLEDLRHPACARVAYDAELPSASVVIVFRDEPYSLLLRTVWSVLSAARRDRPWHQRATFVERGTNRTMALGYPGQEEDSEHVYLKEIILVDDHSTLPELRGKLAHYVRTRLPRGLVRLLRLPERSGVARARQAGARAARGDVLVVLDAHCEGLADWLRPLLQRVKDNRTAVISGFLFSGYFWWIEVPDHEWARRGSEISPTWSPTMSGGLFAMSRSYYWELGGYDEQMAGWGGENLEMSFRIWQCGGTLETVPCARVGHVYGTSRHGERHQDTLGINMARVAEVWMDEYKELFYLHRPETRKDPRVGDVSGRKALRERLRCRSFQWFLDTVYPEKFVPVRDADAYGRDLEMKDQRPPVVLMDCDKRVGWLQWRYVRATQQLRHARSGLCLEALGPAADADARVRACANRSSQRWTFDSTELLPRGVEERLRKLRRRRTPPPDDGLMK